MNFFIIDDNNFKLYVNNKYINFNYDDEDELYESLKNILITLKKKYAFDIYGFYEVNIYKIKELATILNFTKKDDSMLYKTVDLKIIKNSLKDVYLKFSDYFLIQEYDNIKYLHNNYYINAENIKENINNLIEHFEIVIDEKISNIWYIKVFVIFYFFAII